MSRLTQLFALPTSIGVFLAPGGPARAQSGAEQIVIEATVRDFSDSHPDMEHALGTEKNLVRKRLGDDGKPVFREGRESETVRDRQSFDQWYRDVDGLNLATTLPLALRNSPEEPRVYSFEDLEFFPIDDALLGNQGRAHNYHFTLEVHTFFAYEGGESFTFIGDDDLWVFVNGLRVIDLGGVHGSQSETVRFDEIAEEAGLKKGDVYPLSLFFAERHTTASHFTISTTAQLGADDPCGEAVCPSGRQCEQGRCLIPCAAGECMDGGICIDEHCMAQCGPGGEEVCTPADAPVATTAAGDPVLDANGNPWADPQDPAASDGASGSDPGRAQDSDTAGHEVGGCSARGATATAYATPAPMLLRWLRR